MTSMSTKNGIALRSALCLLLAITGHGCIATALVGWRVTGTIVDSDQHPFENAKLEVSLASSANIWTEQVTTDFNGRYEARINTGTKCTLVLIPWILMSPPAGPHIPIPNQVAIHSIEELTIVGADFSFEETKHRFRRGFPWPIVMGGEIKLPTLLAQKK